MPVGFALDGTKWDGLYVGRRKGDDRGYAGKKVDHGFNKEIATGLQPIQIGRTIYLCTKWLPCTISLCRQ